MVFHWSLSDNKSSQVSRTLLSIFADCSNAVFWMISTRPLISKSSSPFKNPLASVPRAPITIGINVTFMFHSFFNSQVRSRYLSFLSVLLCGQAGQQSPQFCNFSLFFFLLIIIRSGRPTDFKWSVCISKSQRSLCVSFSGTDVGLCTYHLFVWSCLNFLHNYYYYYYL